MATTEIRRHCTSQTGTWARAAWRGCHASMLALLVISPASPAGETTVALTAPPNGAKVAKGGSVTLCAEARRNGQRLRGKSVHLTAVVTLPIGQEHKEPLYDNGTHGDPTAGDGQYTAAFRRTQETGQHNARVKACVAGSDFWSDRDYAFTVIPVPEVHILSPAPAARCQVGEKRVVKLCLKMEGRRLSDAEVLAKIQVHAFTQTPDAAKNAIELSGPRGGMYEGHLRPGTPGAPQIHVGARGHYHGVTFEDSEMVQIYVTPSTTMGKVMRFLARWWWALILGGLVAAILIRAIVDAVRRRRVARGDLQYWPTDGTQGDGAIFNLVEAKRQVVIVGSGDRSAAHFRVELGEEAEDLLFRIVALGRFEYEAIAEPGVTLAYQGQSFQRVTLRNGTEFEVCNVRFRYTNPLLRREIATESSGKTQTSE